MNNKNVIEINGKQYDAIRGTVLSENTVVHKTTQSVPAAALHEKTIDGFLRTTTSPRNKVQATVHAAAPKKSVLARRAINHAVAHKPQPAGTVERSTIKPSLLGTAQKVSLKPYRATIVQSNHAKPHKPEAAHTLMRTAVQKPTMGFKRQINVQGSLQSLHIPVVAKKLSVTNIVPSRLARAQHVIQSPHISRFDQSTSHSVPATMAQLPVKAAPMKPEIDTPIAPAPQPTNKPLDMFEAAIANATHFVDPKAHSARLRKKTRNHIASMAAGALALVVFASFAVYQNTPGLQIKVAGMQAGIATTTPNLKAAGFAFTGVKSQSGKLTVGFSGQQGASYQLTQQATSWTSGDMIQNIAGTDASGVPNYQIVQAGTTPIYRFSNTSATWVKNGTWYQVSGKYSLTDQQVQALASNS